MVIFEDSADRAVRDRWRAAAGSCDDVDNGDSDSDSDSGCDWMDLLAVKAMFVEDWGGDETPKAYAFGRTFWSAMTARRVDAIIFMA